MVLNKYIRQLIRTYSEGKRKYSIIKILEDLENKGLNSKWGRLIIEKTNERLVQNGIDPYDRKNKEAVYETLLDVLYEETDLVDQAEALGLNVDDVNEELIKKLPDIIQRNYGFIMEILKRKGNGKVSSIIKDKIPELAQWRRIYSSSGRNFLTKLRLGFAILSAMLQIKAANLPANTNPQTNSPHRIEIVEPEPSTQAVIKDFKNRRIDSLRLEEGFEKFYGVLGAGTVPRGDNLFMLLYNRAVFYTQNIARFKYKFGDPVSFTNTLSELNKDDKRDKYIATVRDLFIASVSGGALEATWHIMPKNDFTNEERQIIENALYNRDYSIEFRYPIDNKPTTNFSNLVVIKIRLDDTSYAELIINIQSLNTFNFYALDTENMRLTKEMKSNFVVVRSESSVKDTYNFYMILPNGIETTAQKVHYLGLVFNVFVKAHKVSSVSTSDGTSGTVGMARLKNKNSRMFRKRKKYEWM